MINGNQVRKFMKKKLLVVGAGLILGLFHLPVGAITTTGNVIKSGEANEPISNAAHSDKTYLLSWQDNKMLTTKGTFVTDGVEIVNESGIDKAVISSQKNLPVLKFNGDANIITKIIILPNS